MLIPSSLHRSVPEEEAASDDMLQLEPTVYVLIIALYKERISPHCTLGRTSNEVDTAKKSQIADRMRSLCSTFVSRHN